jgi:hypothetical protein
MSSRFLCTLLASVCALASLCPATADAQIGRRFVNRAEGPVVARGRNLIGRIIERRRARFLGAEAIAAEQQAAAYAAQTRKPVPQPNGIRQASGIQQTSATQSLKPLRPLPTKAQLAAMDESALWAAWRDTTELLDEQLGSLTTAASWQQHLSTTRALRGELTALPNESKDGAVVVQGSATPGTLPNGMPLRLAEMRGVATVFLPPLQEIPNSLGIGPEIPRR